MPEIVMYTSNWCPYCVRAKQLLSSLDLAVEEINIERDPERREEMMRRSGRRTVPQIFINGESIGGCDELYALHRSGELSRRLAEPTS